MEKYIINSLLVLRTRDPLPTIGTLYQQEGPHHPLSSTPFYYIPLPLPSPFSYTPFYPLSSIQVSEGIGMQPYLISLATLIHHHSNPDTSPQQPWYISIATLTYCHSNRDSCHSNQPHHTFSCSVHSAYHHSNWPKYRKLPITLATDLNISSVVKAPLSSSRNPLPLLKIPAFVKKPPPSRPEF